MDITENQLIQILQNDGFDIHKFGTYLPFIGVIALKLGLKVKYRTVIEKEFNGECDVISSTNKIRRIIYEDMLNTNDGESIMQAYKAFLKILDNEGGIYFHKKNTPPSIRDIKEALNKGPIVVLISCKEYYSINEDWEHALVLVQNQEDNVLVFDSYKKRGFKYYPDWIKHLKIAEDYDWNKWHGNMINFE